jgi:predicted O-methyltransferase YrrM
MPNFRLFHLASKVPMRSVFNSISWHISVLLLFSGIWISPTQPRFAILLIFVSLLIRVTTNQVLHRRETRDLSIDLERKNASRLSELREELTRSISGSVSELREELTRSISGSVSELREEFTRSISGSVSELRDAQVDAKRKSYLTESAISFIVNQINTDRPIWFEYGWSADPILLATLYSEIRSSRPEYILDLGSGMTTLISAYALRDNGGGKVVAWEHMEEYATSITKKLADRGLGDFSKVEHKPLELQVIDGQTYNWFGGGLNGIEKKIDILIVDSPPGSTGRMARFPAIPKLLNHLSETAVVYLDDVHREEEKEILNRWLSLMRTAKEELDEIHNDKRFAVIRLGQESSSSGITLGH